MAVKFLLKMTIAEKIKLAKNINKLVLFKEGIFYKLYHQDAMLFVENVRQFKLTLKYIKTIQDYVNSIGFPVSSFDLQTANFQ